MIYLITYTIFKLNITLRSTKIKRSEISCPKLEVTWRTVAILIREVFFICICGFSLSYIHYNQTRRVYINQGHKYIRLIVKWEPG